ncbi:MAG: hypothetical protein IPK58_05035 [Acidobacteria bacterium]|nr:hypothetical protein [Acidobacteriota bacterium]
MIRLVPKTPSAVEQIAKDVLANPVIPRITGSKSSTVDLAAVQQTARVASH